MTVEEVINQVIDVFDHCGIPYMVAGSFASNVHGIPRSTYDADIVGEGALVRQSRGCHSHQA